MATHDMKAYIYYGPSSWFKAETAGLEAGSLLDIVYECCDRLFGSSVVTIR